MYIPFELFCEFVLVIYGHLIQMCLTKHSVDDNDSVE